MSLTLLSPCRPGEIPAVLEFIPPALPVASGRNYPRLGGSEAPRNSALAGDRRITRAGNVGAKLARGGKTPLSSEDVHVLKILGEALDKFRLGAALNEGTDTPYGGPFGE